MPEEFNVPESLPTGADNMVQELTLSPSQPVTEAPKQRKERSDKGQKRGVRKPPVDNQQASQPSVVLTQDQLEGMLSLIGIVAFGVVARVTNDPNWKLDKDEIEQLGKGLYPVAMKYAGTNAEYAPEALAIITIAGLVAPRILSNANSGQKGKGKNLHAETTSPPNPNGLGRVTLNESSAI